MKRLPDADLRTPLGLASKIWILFVASSVTLAGLFFVVEGGYLASIGGSLYFLLCGVALVMSGLLLFRFRPAGALIFGGATVATAIWAVFDAGIAFWPLQSRLFAFGIAASLIALSYPLLLRAQERPVRRGPPLSLAILTGTLSVATFALMFFPHGETLPSHEASSYTPNTSSSEQRDWLAYGNAPAGTRFASIDKINTGNVKDLKMAWVYHTGDVPMSPGGNGAEDQQTPLQVGGRLFLCTPHNNVISLDADTGAQVWKHVFDARMPAWMRCRGLAYFDTDAPLQQPTEPRSTPVRPVPLPVGNVCRRRIFMNTITAQLYALDADTGEICKDFGDDGRVDLTAGLGDSPPPGYQPTSPPTVAGTVVVTGGRVGDNVQADMPGGVIRAFDVITGRLRWAFDPGNPDRQTPPTPGQTYVRSTPNVWAPMSYDPTSNTVFMPMGNPSPDSWGGRRSANDNRFGSSVVGVDASTGKVKWTYQTVHHDLWDYDVPMQPTLIDFPMSSGRSIPAVVVGTKTGEIFVLDRETGKPLTDVKERTVKPGDVAGERYSPTQPLSIGMPRIGNETLRESDMWGITPFDQLVCRIAFRSVRYEGMFTPPSAEGSLVFPGVSGGFNWGGISSDPTRGLLFFNDTRLGVTVRLLPTLDQTTSTPATQGGENVRGAIPIKGTPFSVLRKQFMSPLGIPCQRPPFGTVTAVDLRTRKIVWQIPAGTVRDTGPLGMPTGMEIPIGMPSVGGTLATQGGLLFLAATQDNFFRAFNSATGKELWRQRLPVGSQGGPMSYISPKSGRQYVVVSVGGARLSANRGDYVIAYSLAN